MERIANLKPASASPGLVKKALDQLGLESHEDYLSATDQAYGLLSASEQLISAGIANPTTRQKISVAMMQDSGPCRVIEHVVACAKGRNRPAAPPVQPLYARPPKPVPRADGNGFNRDVRDAVNIIGGYSKLQEIAERVLHIKQLVDRRYIFRRARKIWSKSGLIQTSYG